MDDAHADNDLFMRVVAGICAVMIVAGFFGVTLCMMFLPIKTENLGPLNQLLGALTLAFGGLMGYLYGRSSIGDVRTRAESTARIVEATKGLPPTDPSGKPIVKVEGDPSNPLPVHDTASAPAPTGGVRGALMTFRSGRQQT